MTSKFYNEDGPTLFDGIVEEEPAAPGKKRKRMFFSGGMWGPEGYMNELAFPFLAGPIVEFDADDEEEDPNP